MKAYAVIGANWGDEGKGHIVDYLARKHDITQVVRFNGGAQAGHTVVAGSERVVFHTLSSGTLAGADTYLARDFILNPIAFREEVAGLNQTAPAVYAYQGCLVTTPWDMVLNQYAASTLAHGTCGMGINETVVRSSHIPLKFYDLVFKQKFLDKLDQIQKVWYPRRAAELGIIDPPQFDFMQKFIDDCQFMADQIEFYNTLPPENTIFEGAQGLALDQNDRYNFPHVTRSNTGIKNIIPDLAKFDEVELIYVSRIYATRHGNGPLQHPIVPTPKMQLNETNIHNQWQGHFRYGALDVDEMARRIIRDSIPMFKTHSDLRISLAFNCLDQVGDTLPVILTGALTHASKDQIIEDIAYSLDPSKLYLSFGPTAADVVEQPLIPIA